MKKLKVPGRIIGKRIPSPYSRYFYPIEGRHSNIVYRFMDDTELPIVLPDSGGNPQNPIVVMANAIRTFWNSPWEGDGRLAFHHTDDVDRDGRDRMGFMVKPPIPNRELVKKLTLVAQLYHSIGILANGSVFPAGRCWMWRSVICPN